MSQPSQGAITFHGWKLTPPQIEILEGLRERYLLALHEPHKVQKVAKAGVQREAVASIRSLHETANGKALSTNEKIALTRAVEKWFALYCKKRKAKEKAGTRDWSVRDVFVRETPSEEIQEKQMELWEEGKERGHNKRPFDYYQRAVTAFFNELSDTEIVELEQKAILWSNLGPPADVRLERAEGMYHKRNHAHALDLYRQGYIRLFILAAWQTPDGRVWTAPLDYNHEMDGAPRFLDLMAQQIEESGIEELFGDYAKIVYPGDGGDPMRVLNTKGVRRARLVVRLNKYGEPIMSNPDNPPPGISSVRQWRIDLARAYFSHWYGRCSGQIKTNPTVPWSKIPHTSLDDFVASVYIPNHLRQHWKDPSKIDAGPLLEMLQHIYARQVAGEDPPFEFHQYLKDGRLMVRKPRKVMDAVEMDILLGGHVEDDGSDDGNDDGKTADTDGKGKGKKSKGKGKAKESKGKGKEKAMAKEEREDRSQAGPSNPKKRTEHQANTKPSPTSEFIDITVPESPESPPQSPLSRKSRRRLAQEGRKSTNRRAHSTPEPRPDSPAQSETSDASVVPGPEPTPSLVRGPSELPKPLPVSSGSASVSSGPRRPKLVRDVGDSASGTSGTATQGSRSQAPGGTTFPSSAPLKPPASASPKPEVRSERPRFAFGQSSMMEFNFQDPRSSPTPLPAHLVPEIQVVEQVDMRSYVAGPKSKWKKIPRIPKADSPKAESPKAESPSDPLDSPPIPRHISKPKRGPAEEGGEPGPKRRRDDDIPLSTIPEEGASATTPPSKAMKPPPKPKPRKFQQASTSQQPEQDAFDLAPRRLNFMSSGSTGARRSVKVPPTPRNTSTRSFAPPASSTRSKSRKK
ncbi:hypothetical protein CC1G_03995 [Coprinopsis cinerea okayama7|uniref:Uncharacterized protein n=1 Tax=Coprinopsis cinerea (strain Okayama-7 / 130 / ATCC MYA-4618 / FGSC 9003) TaxID=240176 RepID=A8N8E8_COPC7|nr:hypothetical protein CC1G_03995 [Coprinopsis cinerea okayama7\|eukprot:XP_001831104.1 hypothetical protein CC1G_03995 [Coprinopsis cinerea okayama7\